MKQIKDLSPDQLADFAFDIFIVKGRHGLGARLIYRCLELDNRHPLGLRCLSDFLDYKGSEAVSGVILEYIVQNNLAKTPEDQKKHEKLLYSVQWFWQFAKHKSGKTELSAEAFDRKEDFIVDQAAYDAFINRAIMVAGDRDRVLKGAHNLIGLYGGVVFSDSIRENHSPIDMLAITNFKTTTKYNEFLQEDSSTLFEIKEKVEAMKKNKA